MLSSFNNVACFCDLSDPYVKVYLLCEGKRIKKKKTTVKKSTLHPVYNEALVFDVPADNVEDVSLIVKVIDYDRYVCCTIIFFLRCCCNITVCGSLEQSEEISHFQTMLRTS